MKKINYLFIIFVLFLFVSCKSKKNVVSTLPRPVLNVDSVRPDSSAAIDDLFAPDHSQLSDLKVSTKKQKKTAKPLIQSLLFLSLLPVHSSTIMLSTGLKYRSQSQDCQGSQVLHQHLTPSISMASGQTTHSSIAPGTPTQGK